MEKLNDLRNLDSIKEMMNPDNMPKTITNFIEKG